MFVELLREKIWYLLGLEVRVGDGNRCTVYYKGNLSRAVLREDRDRLVSIGSLTLRTDHFANALQKKDFP